MTLHAAIEKVLHQKSRPMTTQEIADELNQNKWYTKRDGSLITAFQIHGRTRNYSHLFDRDGTTVSLKGRQNVFIVGNSEHPEKNHGPSESQESSEVKALLMDNSKFISVDEIDALDLEGIGIYCLRIAKPEKLPEPFDGELNDLNHDIMYIGIATVSLERRLRDQELRGNGHGTFFRSMGAILGYRPPVGSLLGKRNKKNYKFSQSDRDKIVSWINGQLLVNVIRIENDFESIETDLIRKYKPLINIAKNPRPSSNLKQLRALCVKIATSPT